MPGSGIYGPAKIPMLSESITIGPRASRTSCRYHRPSATHPYAVAAVVDRPVSCERKRSRPRSLYIGVGMLYRVQRSDAADQHDRAVGTHLRLECRTVSITLVRLAAMVLCVAPPSSAAIRRKWVSAMKRNAFGALGNQTHSWVLEFSSAQHRDWREASDPDPFSICSECSPLAARESARLSAANGVKRLLQAAVRVLFTIGFRHK